MTLVDLEMDMYNSLEAITLGVRQLSVENARMRAALLKAATQFEFYVKQHRDKTPPDEVKAATNLEWVEHCREAAQHGEVTSIIT